MTRTRSLTTTGSRGAGTTTAGTGTGTRTGTAACLPATVAAIATGTTATGTVTGTGTGTGGTTRLLGTAGTAIDGRVTRTATTMPIDDMIPDAITGPNEMETRPAGGEFSRRECFSLTLLVG